VAVVLAAAVLDALAIELRCSNSSSQTARRHLYFSSPLEHSPMPAPMTMPLVWCVPTQRTGSGFRRRRQVLDLRVDRDRNVEISTSAPGLRSDGLSVPGIVS
jgi:hypothetical protein